MCALTSISAVNDKACENSQNVKIHRCGAVDTEHTMTGDPSCLIRTQEQCCVCNILWSTKCVPWMATRECCLHLWILGDRGNHWALYETGTETVHMYAVFRVVDAHLLGHPNNGVFRFIEVLVHVTLESLTLAYLERSS